MTSRKQRKEKTLEERQAREAVCAESPIVLSLRHFMYYSVRLPLLAFLPEAATCLILHCSEISKSACVGKCSLQVCPVYLAPTDKH